jgi:hypothetical protein
MLEAVYFDVKQTKSIVAIKPKPPFRPIFQVAVTREGSGIHIIKNEPSDSTSKNSSVFMVETGETLSLSELRFKVFDDYLDVNLPSARQQAYEYYSSFDFSINRGVWF